MLIHKARDGPFAYMAIQIACMEVIKYACRYVAVTYTVLNYVRCKLVIQKNEF